MYSTLSSSGLQVSKLALGTATFGVAPDPQTALELIDVALRAGINVIDTANSYGNQARFDRVGLPDWTARKSAEALVGEALVGRREQVVLSTKVSEPIGDGPNDAGLGRVHIMRSIEHSLDRLRTDHLDIYVAHHPDPWTDPRNWIRTFDDLMRQGVIRHFGLSNFDGWQVTDVLAVCDRYGYARPVCHHTRYSIAKRWVEAEVLPASRHGNVSIVAYGPLAGGLLSGSSRDLASSGDRRWGGAEFSAADLELAARFDSVAENIGLPPAQLAAAWVLSQPGVACAVVGPESTAELAAVLPALSLHLTRQQVEELSAISLGPMSLWNQ